MDGGLDMLEGILIALFCFILFLLIHVVIFHNRQVKKRFNTLVMIFLSLFPIYVLIYSLTSDFLTNFTSSALVSFLNGILIYILLFFGYGHFYFLVDRSISVRTMVELENSRERKLTYEQLKEVYSPDNLLLRRVGEMLNGKYIIENSGCYKTTRKGRYQARLCKLLKEYLQLGPGG